MTWTSPFFVKPFAKKIAGTSDLTASQLAYKTVQRSLGLIYALNEFADAGGPPTEENLKKASKASWTSPVHNDIEVFMKTLPTSDKLPVLPIHYEKVISNRN